MPASSVIDQPGRYGALPHRSRENSRSHTSPCRAPLFLEGILNLTRPKSPLGRGVPDRARCVGPVAFSRSAPSHIVLSVRIPPKKSFCQSAFGLYVDLSHVRRRSELFRQRTHQSRNHPTTLRADLALSSRVSQGALDP